jgi:signal transduction histidine kinase
MVRRAPEAAAPVNAAVTELRTVAHDLNNVLAAILGCAELLTMRLEGNSPALEEAREIQKAAERGAALVRELLTVGLARPGASAPQAETQTHKRPAKRPAKRR